jgi:tetratricopeptide (TPR) repeat protein
MSTLGQKIRELRIAKGLTQSDLGAGLVTPSMISQIESDKANPSYKVLEAIAEKLETPLEYFLSDLNTQLEQATAYRVAKSMLASGRYAQAAELLCSLRENPAPSLNLVEVQADLADCYLHLSRYEEAEALLTEVVATAKKKGQALEQVRGLYRLGLLEEARKREHLALHHWWKAHELCEELEVREGALHAQILNKLGEVSDLLGEHADALRYYEQAYRLLSNTTQFEQMASVYAGMGQSYRKIGEFERALEYSQYALAIYESLKQVKLSIDVKKQFGVLKREEGAYEEALAILSECMEEYARHHHDVEAAEVRGEIARIYLLQADPKACKEACEQALGALPEGGQQTAAVLCTLAEAEYALGELEAAVQVFERAAALYREACLFGDLAQVQSRLGDLYGELGEYKKANECLQLMRQVLIDPRRGYMFMQRHA